MESTMVMHLKVGRWLFFYPEHKITAGETLLHGIVGQMKGLGILLCHSHSPVRYEFAWNSGMNKALTYACLIHSQYHAV